MEATPPGVLSSRDIEPPISGRYRYFGSFFAASILFSF